MGKGFLKANLYVGNYLLPVNNVKVLVKDKKGNVINELVSDKYGKTDKIALAAPDIPSEDIIVPEFATYEVEVPFAQGYKKVILHDVEVFDKQTTILPIQMQPAVKGYSADGNTDEFYIPTTRSVNECRRTTLGAVKEVPGVAEMTARIMANEVAIPDYITVHLGSPNNDAAQNYRLPFKDYLKNVASREVFPSWNREALKANIYAQMTFALNRIYTLYWRSRNKSFDITNNTGWDQAFDPSKVTFEIMSDIVDEIFTSFIRRQGRREPFFSSYCNGTTATCDGLYQCESQELALRGYNYLQILKYYYPNDIQIVESNNFASGVGNYPGYPLSIGSSGEDVLRMQIYLNRLSGNWWIDPIPAQNVDGIFGPATKRAVTMFQENTPFGLTPDGVIGRNTWYEITRSYVAATELAELTSEGQRIGIGAAPPTVTLYPNTDPVTRGAYVVELQFLLNYIAQFYPNISPVIQNGIFRTDTQRSVIYFQQEAGLTPDGIVGPGTWQALYDVFYSLQGGITTPQEPPTPQPPPSPSVPPFPGTSLSVGSKGSDVLLMQNSLNAIAQVYTSIPILVADGSFGPATQAAVKAFQREFGLSVDGVIGPQTWYKIIEIYNSLATGSGPEFPGTNLTVGSRGNDVLLMQNYLSAIAKVFPVIPTLAADGIFGTGTAASVRAFQSFFGLKADGIIGRDTWNKIVYVYNSKPDVASPVFPGTVLRVGSRGNDVIIMQKYLNLISTQYPAVPPLTADGIFGPGTQQAVIAFQNQFGLTADGAIGVNTWNKIVSVYNQILMYTPSPSSAVNLTRSASGKGTGLDPYAMLLAMRMFRKF